MQLRVAVYNLKAFRLGHARVVDVVRRIGPDVLIVNESGSRRSLRRLGAAMEMDVAADPLTPLGRRIKNAVLVRPPWRIIASRLHRFERTAERFYPRGAMVAQAGRAGRRVWVISAHLGLVPAERVHHARELTRVIDGLEGPVVLGGDLNETPERPAAGWLAGRLSDAWAEAGDGPGETFPSTDPTARIDYLFVSDGVRVDRARVARGAANASDHLPVVADLTLHP